MDHQDYQLITVSEADDWAAYHDIRRKILFEARGKFAYDPNHPDEYDPKNKPLLLKFRGVPIGTTRLDFLRTKEGVIRLVAIKTEYQNAGHGRVLSTLVEDRAKANGITTLFVNAAPEAVAYYEKTGYERHVWSPSELQGIAADCIQMRKRLQRLL